MSERWRRAAEAVLGLGVIALAVVWLSGGCGERIGPGDTVGEPPRAAAGAPGVAVERSTSASVEWTSGAVESARRTAVASRILARIEEIPVTAGAEVQVGDLLVRLDARDLEASAEEAAQALRGARAALALARTEQARVAELVRQGVEAQQRLDRTRATLDQATAEVDRLEQIVSEAGTGLTFAEIRSPVSGRVVDRLAEPGDTAVPGRPLLRIYDPSVLRVEAPVRESLAVGLRVGEPLRVRVPALDSEIEGVIDEIVPFAEPGARTLLVKVRLPADERLFAGLFARVAVPAGQREQLLVPAAAVERIGQLEFVTVLPPEGPPRRRLVTTGPEAEGGRVEVLSGLAAGERVAVPPGAAG